MAPIAAARAAYLSPGGDWRLPPVLRYRLVSISIYTELEIHGRCSSEAHVVPRAARARRRTTTRVRHPQDRGGADGRRDEAVARDALRIDSSARGEGSHRRN